ncbi:phage major capsid protein [Phascolarctobacterium sp.]|uniref:phage major capsid protein n=1 Tax=Phascolarctobacterium sp. TaxID=2049039 RepID=UPI00386834C8
MNRQAQALLAKINAKVAEVKALAQSGDLAKVKAAKKELDEMQEMFDCIKDLDDEAAGAAGAAAAGGSARVVDNAPTIGQKVKAFIGVLTAGIRRVEADAEDVKIYNAMAEGTNSGKDGGLTVPQDIRTQIEELRRTDDDLEQYVNVEKVSTLTGSRVIEEDADATPWDNVDEAAQFPDAATPQFRNVEYKITKKGGILKITEELLQDTAENIMGYLKKYIAKKTRATRNAFILAKIKDVVKFGKEGSTVKPINGIDGLKDVFNVDLDPAIAAGAVIITNQSGFNYLDKMKDSDGNYIMQPDPTQPTKKILFGAYPVVKLMNKTLPTREVKAGEAVTGYAYPIICGDLKEAITLFDRENMTIEISNTAGDLWGKDQTGVKVRDRFDVREVDTKAFVFGEITEAVNG